MLKMREVLYPITLSIYVAKFIGTFIQSTQTGVKGKDWQKIIENFGIIADPFGNEDIFEELWFTDYLYNNNCDHGFGPKIHVFRLFCLKNSISNFGHC